MAHFCGVGLRFSVFLGLGLFTSAILAACSSNPPAEIPDDAAAPPDTSTPTQPGQCPTGYQACGMDCFATKRDPLNCGGCGKACKAGEVCVQGGCALQCGGNATKCGALCVSTKSDPENCGMCASK